MQTHRALFLPLSLPIPFSQLQNDLQAARGDVKLGGGVLTLLHCPATARLLWAIDGVGTGLSTNDGGDD